MTTVSVVIPTRDRSRLLQATVRSALQQRDVDLEVIVVDDASSDGTTAMLADLSEPRLAVLRNRQPLGPAAARNLGGQQAAGEWLAFLDDDDLWAPDKLSRQLAAAASHGRRWAYAGTVTVGEGLELLAGTPPPAPAEVVRALPRYNAVPGGGSNVVVNRRLFTDLGGFDPRLPPCEDWELWLRLARAGPPATAFEPLVAYRVHSGSSSLDTARITRSARLIEELHAAPVDWGRLQRWFAESSLRNEQHLQAVGHLLRAAAQGQARGVAEDLAAILGRRLGRRGRPERPRGASRWAARAEVWLEPLRAQAGARESNRS